VTWLRGARATLMSPWLLLYVALLIGYMLLFRLTLPGGGATYGSGEVVALFATDPYHLLYIAAPTWLIVAIVKVRREVDPQILLRSGSRVRWAAHVLRTGSPALAVGLLALLIVWCLAGSGLTASFDWNATDRPPTELGLPQAALETGLAPIGLVAAQLGALVVAGSTVLLVFAFAATVLSRWSAAGPLAAIVMFLAPIVGHVLGFGSGPQALLSPLASQYALGAWPVGGLVAAAAAVIILAGLAVADRRTTAVRPGWRTGFALYALVSITLLVGSLGLLSPQDLPLASYIAILLQGAVPGGSAIAFFLLATLVYLGPAALFAGRLEDRLHGVVLYELVRLGTVSRFLARHLRASLLRSAAIVTTLAAAVTLLWAAGQLGGTPQAIDAPAVGLEVVAFQLLVTGTLQLVFLETLTLTVMWITGRSTSGLLTLAVVVVLGYLPFTAIPLLPVYANSLSYALLGWPAVASGAVTLVISILITLGVVSVHTRRRGITAVA
jgi:hypothetical protein